MNVTFIPLTESHFPLLLKWLETPSLKRWWDQDVVYNSKIIKEKYGSYVQGHKKIDGVHKPIKAYIISLNEQLIGYIQFYNAYDFPRHPPLIALPRSLGALDSFIGEPAYLRQNIGSTAIKKFTHEYVLKTYQYAFVDPQYNNEAAVRAYEKADFVIFKRVKDVFWMLAHQKMVRLSIQYSIALEMVFKDCFLKEDTLWVFGSRVDLNRKGGDIDLYIETNAKTVDEAADMKLRFISRLQHIIGEQKIDVVLNILHFSSPLPIYTVAKTTGVRII